MADLFRIHNVPTSVWIDERGRIARPNDAIFGSDDFVELHGIPSGPQLEALRAWVRDGVLPLAEDEVRKRQVLPTDQEQLARAEFALARALWRRGRGEAAERHLERAAALAPHDLTIRRGSMRMRGLDPMGADVVPLIEEWSAAGTPYYEPMHPPEKRRGRPG